MQHAATVLTNHMFEATLEIVAEASALIDTALDPEATLRKVTELAVPRLADCCTIHILNDDNRIEQLAVAHRDPAKAEFVWELERNYPIIATSSLGLPQVLRTATAEIVPLIDADRIDRFSQDDHHRTLLHTLHLRSSLVLPLVARGRTLGAISFLMMESERSYTADDLPGTEALARPAAFAIDNARLYAAEQRARAAAEAAVSRLTQLQAITASLSEALTPADVVNVVIEQALGALGASAGSIRQLSDDGTSLEVVRITGYSDEMKGTWHSVPLNQRTQLTDAFRSGMPIFIESIEKLRTLYPAQAIAAEKVGYHAFVTLPLLVEGRVIGAMNLSFEQPQRFTDDDRAFMDVLAQQCAQALDRARRYDQERIARAAAERTGDRLALLADASAVLSSSLDYTITLQRIADLVVKRLADMCRVAVVGDSGVEQDAVAAVGPHLAAASALLAEYPFDPAQPQGEGLALRTGEGVLIPQIDLDAVRAGVRSSHNRQLLQQLDLLSLMSVPLLVRGQTLGLITCISTTPGRIYDAEDLKLVENLASRIAIAVDNARLYHEAQNAIRARDVFLSIAAHELNTPITALLGFSDILHRQVSRDEAASPRDQLVARTINEQAIRLHKLTHMLLDVSRIQTDQLQLEWSHVNLCTLLSRAAKQIGSTTDRHTIVIECVEDVMIEADELRLEQVVYNLIQNAVKYSPAGGTVQVRMRSEASEVTIEVADPGVGIPAAELEHLFSRFYRASNVDHRRISGMGLGLFIVRQIVDLHGGTVMVQSREGAGSTFCVRLPRSRSA